MRLVLIQDGSRSPAGFTRGTAHRQTRRQQLIVLTPYCGFELNNNRTEAQKVSDYGELGQATWRAGQYGPGID